ncbi:MAG: rRNA adenine N-6-methyltransferase family protein [Acidobacteriaceae bacterium]
MELTEVMLFARTFLKEPKMLGSVIPSSRFLTNRLLRMMDWQRARLIVEFGPGIGNITSEILRKLHRDGKLVCMEMNEGFVRHLREMPDPRLVVEHDSAENVSSLLALRDLGSADYIVSGIPFSTLPDTVRRNIVRNSYRALRPGGEMIVYQFSNAVLPDLKAVFGRVEEQMEPLNILPARVFRAIKS